VWSRVVLCRHLVDTAAVSATLIDGKYELVEIAGEGGMATVFRAVVRGAAGFQRTVAVKRIRPEFRALKNYIDMFIEEARVGSELAHPNIVQVHDFCAFEGAYYLIMEWVEGIDLGTLQHVFLRAGRHLPWSLVTGVSIGALRGLAAAHDRRTADGEPAPVIHRDVSPHNILVGSNGVAKLTDFGLARARDRAYSLTVPGTVKGKLSYLAPEVTLGKPNSVASDLFSMGVVMWEMLVGYRLFDARNDLDVFKKIRACEVPPLLPLRPDVPPALAAAIARTLSLDPAARPASAGELIAELSRVQGPGHEGRGGDSQEQIAAAVEEARALRKQGRASRPPAAATAGSPNTPQAAQAPTRPSEPPRAVATTAAPTLPATLAQQAHQVRHAPAAPLAPHAQPGQAQRGAERISVAPLGGSGESSGDSLIIEISTADLSVEPLPLDKPKR
jgi:eukaryotic-like serine/threonine-protein kinase